MAKEYIEREAAIKELVDDYAYAAADLIEKIPTAYVQEVRHGKWLPKHYEGGLIGGTNVDECSECGYERLIRDLKYRTVYNFCPDCGAKMDKE